MTDSSGSRLLVRPVLMSSRLTRQAEIEVPGDGKPSFSYSAAIEFISRSDKYTIAFVLMKIEQQYQGKNLVELSTTYMTGFSGEGFTSEDAEFTYFENIIEVSVWPRFRDLSQVVISQAELDFPILPPIPESITRPKKRSEESASTG